MANYIHFSTELQKMLIIWIKALSKSCLKLNFLQKISEHICLLPHQVELGGSKD